MEVLLIEDEQVLGKALRKGLVESGHECEWVRNGAKGLELASEQRFDVLVLDLMLPDLHGRELLIKLRNSGIHTPVLVLTAMGSVEDRVAGLQAGADDYLVKPFAFAELTARLEAICRRSGIRPSMTLEVRSLQLDMTTRKVTRENRDIDLSPTEFSVLEYLMRHSGQVVTRKMLNEHLWGEDWGGMTNVIDVHINHLRRKIDRGFEEPLIHTVRGRGYVLRPL